MILCQSNYFEEKFMFYRIKVMKNKFYNNAPTSNSNLYLEILRQPYIAVGMQIYIAALFCHS